MDRSNKQTNLYTNDTRRSVPVQRNIFRSWLKQPHNYQQGDRGYQCNRHNKYLPAIALCLTSIATAPATLAETVGGVSATAAPIANSSGSVTNQAIQVLQGPYITNTYGGGIQCQGPTVNFTPFVTGSASMQKPYEDYWDSPVYDMTTDDDGNLNNPGDILYFVPTRTGQKDNYNISVGFSATWSTPQDKKLQALCKEAAAANIALMNQQQANKRLDFEIARLKNCGELLKSGIRFVPGTKYARICADVQVLGKNVITPHVHSIPSPSTSESRGSSNAALLGGPVTTGREQTSRE